MWLLLWASVAFADGGLVSSWASAKSVSYNVQTLVNTPRGRRWYAEENVSARATRQMLLMGLSCAVKPAGKRTALNCTILSVEFRGAAVEGEEELLASIFKTNERLLHGRSLQIEVRSDGRIVSIDLDAAIPVQTSKSGRIMENLRQMVERALAPLDLQLPKSGSDKGKPWKQKGMPLSMKLMTDQGTSGSVVLKHRVVQKDGDRVRLESQGRGTVAEGSTMEQGSSTMLHVTTTGRSEFNTAEGLIEWSEVESQVKYAAANLEGLVSPDRSTFSSRAERVR